LIDKAKGVINEQTRHKKNIESNISYRENLDEVEVLKAEVATLKDEYDSIEGADEAREIYTANEAKQTKLSQTLSKIEGKFEMVTAEIKVSERSERALMKTSILAMNQHPRNEMPTDIMATSTTKLTHSILLTRFVRFALASLKMRTISLRSRSG